MTRPSPVIAGLLLRCPHCGKGKLFKSYLKVKDRCDVCSAKLGETDSGDAPMVFAILILGFAIVGAALFVELRYMPPYWLHAVLWLPSLAVGSWFLLPLLKSVFYAVNYHYDAGEDLTGRMQ